jgi:hypothetical protein
MTSLSDISLQVARILTDLAREELTGDEQRGVITVKVRDDGGVPVSMGTLTFRYEVFSAP